MSQSEIPRSAESSDDCIEVWPWIKPERGEIGGVDRAHGRVWLAPSQVSWAEVKDHWVRLHTVTGAVYAMRGTLKSLEQRWAKYDFMRIHDWFLVFLPHVQRFLRPRPDAWEIYLKSSSGGRYFPISRRKRREFQEWWGRPPTTEEYFFDMGM
jgi:DNA-binding LytR/AlgR family response regulator